MDKVDVELLISLVEARPPLWDKTIDDYKDKHLKAAAWREICVLLIENFEEMVQKERQNIGKLLVKKWTHIRDAWTKSLKKQRMKKKSGSAAKKSRPYVFNEQLSFLKKVTDLAAVHESAEISDDGNDMSIDDGTSEPQNTEGAATDQKDKTQSTSASIRNKKRKLNALDATMMKFMEHQMAPPDVVPPREEENRHLTFFKSLLPSLYPFDDDETLELQTGILHLIQQIKAKKRQFQPYRTPMQYNTPTFGAQSNRQYSVQTPHGYYTQPATNTVVASQIPSTDGTSGNYRQPTTNTSFAPPMPSPSDISQQSPATQSIGSEGSAEYSQQSFLDLDVSDF